MNLISELKEGKIVSGAQAMEALGISIAKEVPKDWTLRLYGDLGVGKTTLVRGIAKGFGIEQQITSPTYALFNVYEGKCQLLHLDAYRLKGPDDLEALSIEEFMQSPFCMAIEWPSLIEGAVYGEGSWDLELSISEPGKHKVLLKD